MSPIAVSPLPPIPNEWVTANSASPRGVAILIAGLNNIPELMTDLSNELLNAGYHTYVLRLTGHERGSAWPDTDYRSAWLLDFERAVNEAKTRYPTLPRVVVGYSLGATIALAASNGRSDLFERAVFFAPALALKFHTVLIRLSLPLRFFSLALPSLAPKQWRAHNTTSIQAYKGMFDLIDEIDPEKIKHLPLCFVLDPQDELISFLNTERWITANSLSHIRLIENATSAPVEKRHLLVDRQMRGESSWQEMKSEMMKCLSD